MMAHVNRLVVGGEWCDASGGRSKAAVNPATEHAIGGL